MTETVSVPAGRRIVLGVSGGIAAYKAVLLLRLLTANGHDVTVVPTAAALQFVGAPTFEALSGHPVHTSVFEAGGAQHVRLGREADLVIVAPATADLLARAATGQADDLLTATLLMTRAPVIFAPAMHTEMWRHPATRANVATLQARPGIHFAGPDDGPLAGGDAGEGRMASPGVIAALAGSLLAPGAGMAGAMGVGLGELPDGGMPGPDDGVAAPGHAGPGEPRDLSGLNVVVTAGGTREAIDPVRFVGNRSSGRQGIALAERAVARGARVRLIAANPSVPIPAQLDGATTCVTSSAELSRETRRAAKGADVVVMAAAVADFRPTAEQGAKVKREGRESLTIEMEPTEDILAGLIARRRPGQVIVGFAAETGDDAHSAEELGRAKAQAKGADLLVCNEVGEAKGFESPVNRVVIFDPAGEVVARAEGPKAAVADAVWSAAAALVPPRGDSGGSGESGGSAGSGTSGTSGPEGHVGGAG